MLTFWRWNQALVSAIHNQSANANLRFCCYSALLSLCCMCTGRSDLSMNGEKGQEAWRDKQLGIYRMESSYRHREHSGAHTCRKRWCWGLERGRCWWWRWDLGGGIGRVLWLERSNDSGATSHWEAESRQSPMLAVGFLPVPFKRRIDEHSEEYDQIRIRVITVRVEYQV